MTNPAATAQFSAEGAGIQKAFGGTSPTPQEQQLYKNPVGWTLAPFIGLVDASQGQSTLGSTPTNPNPPPGPTGPMRPGGQGFKTLLGQ